MAKPRLRGSGLASGGLALSSPLRRHWQNRLGLGLRPQPSLRRKTGPASIPVVTVGFKNTGVRRIINHYAQVETEAENLRWRYLELREQLRQAKTAMKDTRHKSRTLIVACALKLVEKDKEIEQLRHEKDVQLSALSRQLTELQAGLMRERMRLNAAIAEKERAISLQDRLIRRLKESSAVFNEDKEAKRVAVVRAFREDSGRETDTESNLRGELFVDLDGARSSSVASSPSSLSSTASPSGPASSSVSPISVLRAALSPCSTYSSLHASAIVASPCSNLSQIPEVSMCVSPLASPPTPSSSTASSATSPTASSAVSPRPIQRPAFCTFLEEAGMNHEPISSSKVLINNNNNINNTDLITSSNIGDCTLPLVPKTVSVDAASTSSTFKTNNLRPILKNLSRTSIPMVCNVGKNYVSTIRISDTDTESTVSKMTNIVTTEDNVAKNAPQFSHVAQNNVPPLNTHQESSVSILHTGPNIPKDVSDLGSLTKPNTKPNVPTVGHHHHHAPIISPSMLANHKNFKKPSEVKSQSQGHHRPPSKANLRTFTSDMAPLEEHHVLDSGRISSITYL